MNLNQLSSYLKIAEGTKIHWNKGEKSFTSLGGIYAYYHKSSIPIRYIQQLAKKYNVNLVSRNISSIRRLNRNINLTEHNSLWNKVSRYIYYTYSNAKVFKYLDTYEKITFISCYMNANTNALKEFQKVINATPDGKIGPKTIESLRKFKLHHHLVIPFTFKMEEYYKRISRGTSSRSKRNRRNLKGWLNRMKYLRKIYKERIYD